MERRKVLVLLTAGIALILFLFGGIYEAIRWPDRIHIETKGNPTIGKANAKIEVVLFEDLRCPHCCAFSTQIFPLIQKEYIEKGIVRYTIIPVAFLDGSKPIANAALAVYRQNPERFFAYAQQLAIRCLKGKSMDEGELYQIAKDLGGINLIRLQECLDSHCYYDELDRNLHLARRIMGKDFATPSLYVDGIFTSTSSYKSVQSRIDKILSGKEVL